jgi:7-carboxy-7-deazaguanine synthase
MSYFVKEIFPTVQGEGFHAGTPALFIRMSVCNLWSGREEHRGRDSMRHGAVCPLWCDTDFVGGQKMSLQDIKDEISEWFDSISLVVVTGGEPLLQLDDELVSMLHENFDTVAVETNGTASPRFDLDEFVERVENYGLWITMSPKTPNPVLSYCHELKVVYPSHDPLYYSEKVAADHHFVQPVDLGDEEKNKEVYDQVLSFVMDNPDWRVSVQTHKILGAR